MCAKLRMSMYGTKAAAQNWQKKVQETMATLGFSIGMTSPVLFCHPQRSLNCLVHGDDFVVSGEPVDLVWMRRSQRFGWLVVSLQVHHVSCAILAQGCTYNKFFLCIQLFSTHIVVRHVCSSDSAKSISALLSLLTSILFRH